MHKVGGCTLHAGSESLEHLELKSLIADAARRAGWDASIEHPASDRSWIADVMVEKDSRQIALEIQLSPQLSDEFLRRQKRYEDAGIECRWYIAARNSEAAQEVPAHVLGGSLGSWTTTAPAGFAGEASIALREAVENQLNGVYRPFIEVAVRAYSLNLAMAKCWQKNCQKWMTLWRLEDLQVETRCGHAGTLATRYALEDRLFPDDRIERVIAPKVLPILRNKDFDLPKPAGFKKSYSKPAGKEYLAYRCPTCGSMQGDAPIFFLDNWRWQRHVIVNNPPTYVKLPIEREALRVMHVCEDTGRGRCNQNPDEQQGAAFPDSPTVKVHPIGELLTEYLSGPGHYKNPIKE